MNSVIKCLNVMFFKLHNPCTYKDKQPTNIFMFNLQYFHASCSMQYGNTTYYMMHGNTTTKLILWYQFCRIYFGKFFSYM